MMFGFGKVLDVVRDGDAVRREGWPAGQKLMLVPGSQFQVEAHRPLGKALGEEAVGQDVHYGSHLDLVTPVTRFDVTSNHVVVWTPSNADLLAEDWDYARPKTPGQVVDDLLDELLPEADILAP